MGPLPACASRPVPASALIVKLAAIGDVIMALPMVTALRAADAGVRITWLSGRTAAPLLRCVEGIDEVVEVDDAAILAGSLPGQLASVLDSWRRIGIRRFDGIYIAHADSRYRALTLLLAAPTRRSLHGGPSFRAMVPGRAHTDEYVRLVTGDDDRMARSFPPPAIRSELSEDLRERLVAFNPEGRPLIALSPGGARNVARENPLRRWPLDRYAELADTLALQGYRVVVTGDRTDGWIRRAFLRRPVLDLVGATDLPALAALFRRCAVVVGHDSGPLHLSRALGLPTLALLGPTAPAMFLQPQPGTTYLWPGGTLPCAPCYDGRAFSACRDNLCMQMIDSTTVARHVTRIVEQEGPG